MATRYIRNSLNKTVNLAIDNSRWELSAGKYVKNTTTPADTGIEIKTGADNVSLAIKGKIAMSGDDYHVGLDILGENAKMSLAKGASITSSGYGIMVGYTADTYSSVELEQTTLSIAGTIKTSKYGIYAGAADTRISIAKTGQVIADNTVIMFDTGNVGEAVTITNAGLIKSNAMNGDAIYVQDASLNLVNRGTIEGRVYGGTGTDRFDLRGGILNGTVSGNDGDDTYIVADRLDAAGTIVETAQAMVDKIRENSFSWGTDLVRSSGSVDLSKMDAQFLDDIALFGTADINATGNAEKNRISGNLGNNVLSGGDGNDFINGFAGNDTINGDGGADLLYGGEGSDTMNGGDNADYIYGDAGDDTLNGDSGSDSLYGWVGTDKLFGGEGDDILSGSFGDDVLDGGDGDDTMDGGNESDILHLMGADTATGGTGADIFILHTGFDGSTIKDYADGVDKIDMTALAVDGANAAAKFNALVIEDTFPGFPGIGCQITIKGETLILDGINKAVLDVTDFIF